MNNTISQIAKASRRIVEEALFVANDREYNTYRGYIYYDYRKSLEAHFDPKLELIADGIDYGPLNCFVEAGNEAYPDVKAAVKKGIIDGWGMAILAAAENAVNEESENAEDDQ